MPYTIPNTADAAFAAQAAPDKVDIDILQAGIRGDGVVTGCAVTAQGSPDMTLAVAAGTIRIAAVDAAVTSGNVTITTADGTNPRIDLVVVNSSGTKSVTAGTAAASPVCPAIPATSVVLAMVYVPAADTAINTNQITDKRCDLTQFTSAATTFANTPAASSYKGGLLYTTDIGGGTLSRSDGSSWTTVAPGRTAVMIPGAVVPTSSITETMPRAAVTTNTLAAPATGVLRMVGIWLPFNQVVTSLSIMIGTTALASGTNSWGALYDSARNLLRQSTNITSPVAAASTVVTFTLSSTFTTTYSGMHYLGFMWTATTMPTLQGSNGVNAVTALPPILTGTSSTGLTTTAPNPAAALTGVGVIPYAYVS